MQQERDHFINTAIDRGEKARGEPKTVSTVFLPTQMFVSMTPARLTVSQRIEERQRETVKTVEGF
jgi:hypothetical protein